MSTAQEIKTRRAELQTLAGQLEERLAGAAPEEAGRLRMELAGVQEDLNACVRALRGLMPRHRVTRRRTWGTVAGESWDQLQYQTWAELEQAEDPDGPTERELMRRALWAGRRDITETQARYLREVSEGTRQAEVARQADRDRSTVSRTVTRANRRLQEHAGSAYALLHAAWDEAEEGRPRLDLSRPEHLAAWMGRLTERQQTYLLLYYGEWMSLREIGTLLHVSHVSVLRGIQRGLERLEACFEAGQAVQVDGLEQLEDLLMAYYNQIPVEWLETARTAPHVSGWHHRPPLAAEQLDGVDLSESTVRWSGGTGRLRQWLAQRYEEAERAGKSPAAAVWRLLRALLRGIRGRLTR